MMTKKTSGTFYCHQESCLGPHPRRPKDLIYVYYDFYAQTGYIVLEAKFILVCGISLIACETWNVKARSPNFKLFFWGNAFTNVSSSKCGIERPSEMQSKCVFNTVQALVDKPMWLCFCKSSSFRNLHLKLGINSITLQVQIPRQTVKGW